MNPLLTKLTQLEFYAIDLQLYIDTHPENRQAIAEYNRIVAETGNVREQYEKCYGPLYNFVSMINDNKSDWIDEPWPWEYRFYVQENK